MIESLARVFPVARSLPNTSKNRQPLLKLQINNEGRKPEVQGIGHPQVPSHPLRKDDAMTAIERDNSSLKGVLPKDYARPGVDKQRLGQLINLISDIGLGSPADRAKDVLGIRAKS